MKTAHLKLALALIVLGGAAGCSRPNSVTDSTAGTTMASEMISQSVDVQCQNDAPPVNLSQLEINRAVGQVGQKVKLSLNQSISCAQAQSLVWQAQDKLIGYGQGATAHFAQAGNFKITVQAAADLGATAQALTVLNQATIVNDRPLISGPQVGLPDQLLQFELVLPAAVSAQSIVWNSGDGSTPISSLAPVQVSYFAPGVYQLTATLTESSGQVVTVAQQVEILPFQEGPLCAYDQITLLGPSLIERGQQATFTVQTPSCFTSLSRSEFNFGDGLNMTVVVPPAPASAVHSFSTSGDYNVTVILYTTSATQPFVTLVRQVRVVEPVIVPTPTPSPSPSPTPNLNECPSAGAVRRVDGATSVRKESCGLNGFREVTEQSVSVQTCNYQGDILKWMQTSTETQILSTGACQGQSCSLGDGAGAGILLDGSSKHVVLPGTVIEPVQCPFGETGVVNTYQQVGDVTCHNGNLQTSSLGRGDLLQAGQCPTYHYVGSENWSKCSADCGGVQSREFECRNQNGERAESSRCSGVLPTETRVCDGNPDAVKRTESKVSHEEAPSCGTCPKNQIGIISKERDVTETKTYACVEHSVRLVSDTTVNGPWVEEKYCRDYVPHRCSQDSLSTPEANGRYAWMVKCSSSVPVIKEFLDNFATVKGNAGSGTPQYGLVSNGRVLYATFMQLVQDSKTSAVSESVWLAPKTASASCAVPAKAYVAAVCLSSCATPEQEILVMEKGRAEKRTFIDSLFSNQSHVATLGESSQLQDRRVKNTRVDQWVTEMIDTEHDILVFRTRSGGELHVTPNHPVLAQDGTMKLAADFAAGEALTRLGGEQDLIMSIEKTKYFGKVYNLFVKSTDLKRNVVVTNGYLNGTAFYQNEGAKNMNRVIFRKNLIGQSLK